MFCIVSNHCPKAEANGHCSVFTEKGVAWRNRRGGFCVFPTLPEAKFATKPIKVTNALKASKRAAAGQATK
jgi:hypothetical protein